MIPHIPWYITLTILVTQPLIALAIWRIAASGASRPVRLGLGVALAAWLGLALFLAPAPESLAGRDLFYVDPLIPSFALGAFTLAIVGFALFPAVRHAVAAASLPALIGVQVYRVLGVMFVVLLAQGQLPGHFAEPAGWGDIFVGLTAVPVALALGRRVAGARTLAVAWNVLGLLDVLVAVGMGTGFLAPYLMPGVGSRLGAAAAMGVFPLILVPTFVVPLSFILHVIALVRLRRAAPAGARLMPRTAV